MLQEENKRGKQKRLVSYDVFMKYVTSNTMGLDISKVFSKECFEEWIENRKRTPKEPEESFRKALVAHVSGKDDRKPFPEDVEYEILKRLRESQPWPCFINSANGASKIGERGLKKSSLGYHESKRRRVFENQSQLNQDCLRYNYYSLQPHFPLHVQDSFVPMVHQVNISKSGIQSERSSFKNIDEMQQETKPGEHTKILSLIRKQAVIGSNCNSGAYARALMEFYSEYDILTLATKVSGLFDESLIQELDSVSSVSTSQHFLSPNSPSTVFDSTTQIGMLVLSPLGDIWTADAITDKILQARKHSNIFASFRSSIDRALFLRYILPLLLRYGYTWGRMILDGKEGRIVLLVNISLNRDRGLSCRIQDESLKHSELLN